MTIQTPRNDPRHGRLFDLLTQQSQTEAVEIAASDMYLRKIDDEELCRLRDTAIRSFMRPN